MTELNNTARDVIGALRATNFLTILWNLDSLLFPLDSSVKRVLARYRVQFEEMLVVVADLGQFISEYRQLRSALDDIIDPSGENPLTEEDVTLLLSLYSGDGMVRRFTYSQMNVFRRETSDIFKKQLGALFDAILWTRTAYFEFYPTAHLLPRPPEKISHFFNILHEIIPASAPLPTLFELEVSTVRAWLTSDAVRRGLELTNSFDENGLRRDVDELKVYEWNDAQ
jgi:hypothetical protein